MRACGVGQKILVRVCLFFLYLPHQLPRIMWILVDTWAIQKQSEILEGAKANPTMGALASGPFINQ